MLSKVAASIYFPFGENFTKETGGLSSSMSVLRHCPEVVSQIRLKGIEKRIKRIVFANGMKTLVFRHEVLMK